jgi:hypothetical protein
MPPSVTVAAFAFGMALLLAAIIGKEIKIVAIELSALKGPTRVAIGVLGVALVAVGLLDLRPAPPPAAPTATATSAPALTATPTAAPTPAPAPAASTGRTLFLSDFEQDRGDWLVGSEINDRGAVTRLVAGGQYQWSVAATAQGGYQMAPAKGAPALADFELQVEAREVSGDAFYGVIFRNTGAAYYVFLVHGRDYALYRIDGQGQTVVLSQADSPAIQRDAANVLKVVAAGPGIRLYIDGALVGETNGAQPAAGTLGIYVNVPGGSQASLEFDNFQVLRPEGSG